jgi:hypothetical protein
MTSRGVLCVTVEVWSTWVRRRYLITKKVIAPTTMQKKNVVVQRIMFQAQSTSTARFEACVGRKKLRPALASVCNIVRVQGSKLTGRIQALAGVLRG